MSSLLFSIWPKEGKMIDRFLKFVSPEPNTGCWLWMGGCSQNGYGAFKVNGRQETAHRIAYSLLRGEIPEGLQLDHLCRVRCCVNPDHLEPVTPKENIRRSPIHSGAKTHCPQGHAYTAENTGKHAGERFCRKCARKKWLDYYYRVVKGAA